MAKLITKGFNSVTDVKFVAGFVTGCGAIAVILAHAVGLF